MQRLTPEELTAMRQAFESLDACGHRDMSYDSVTRTYFSGFTQAKWVNWQIAWREGQKYLLEKKAGKPSKVEEEPPRRTVRVSRTPQS